MKIKCKIFFIVLIIEIVLLLLGNMYINYSMFNTKMAAGSHAYYAPLLFSETRFSNSQLIADNFSVMNLVINIIIILIIPLIISLLIRGKK